MTDFQSLISSFRSCSCGTDHRCDIRDIRIGCGLVSRVGSILRENGFGPRLLVTADRNTLQATEGILESLDGFQLTLLVKEDARLATMNDVREVESYSDRVDGVLAIGTGSIDDPCRLACANRNMPLCLFATAPSMDGFASYGAPIVDGNFKLTYPAKSPEVIIGDTKILARSPARLKSAGFGDMIAKYVALIDWKVSHILTGESYCDRVAALTRLAADRLMEHPERVILEDEETAGAVFETLLLTGIAMSFTRTSRPASGTEHIMAHFWECQELLQGKTPNFHGEDVGIATLMVLKYYNALASLPSVRAHKEINDWQDIYRVYGALADDVRKLNTPDTITDGLDPKDIEEKWPEITECVRSVPSYETCLRAMELAGCRIDYQQAGKDPDLVEISKYYHPYMRRRLSLLRVSHMLDLDDSVTW